MSVCEGLFVFCRYSANALSGVANALLALMHHIGLGETAYADCRTGALRESVHNGLL